MQKDLPEREHSREHAGEHTDASRCVTMDADQYAHVTSSREREHNDTLRHRDTRSEP